MSERKRYVKLLPEQIEDLASQWADHLRARQIGEKALAAEKASDVAPYAVLGIGDVTKEPRPPYVLERFAWEGALTIWIAPPNEVKTFALLAAAAAVSSTSQAEMFDADADEFAPGHFLGLRAQSGSVIYVSFESGDALGMRSKALQDRGLDMKHFHLVRASDPISPSLERDGTETQSPGAARLAKTITETIRQIKERKGPPVVLLIIDTVRASLSGSEDSSEDVSAYIRALRGLMALIPRAACVAAHHAGWQDGEQKKKRERGSSDFRGSSDGSFYFEREEEDASAAYFTLRCLKTRDDRKRNTRLIRQTVDVTYLGHVATTCVVHLDPRTDEDVNKEKKQEEDAEKAAIEMKVLTVISRNAKLTSQTAVRDAVGGNRDMVVAALSRLEGEGYVEHEGQRRPYRVTEAGKVRLSGGGKS